MVEQLAFNQRVAGSSPARLIEFNTEGYQIGSLFFRLQFHLHVKPEHRETRIKGSRVLARPYAYFLSQVVPEGLSSDR